MVVPDLNCLHLPTLRSMQRNRRGLVLGVFLEVGSDPLLWGNSMIHRLLSGD